MCAPLPLISTPIKELIYGDGHTVKTFGCGSAIASSSYMTERVKGMTLEEAGQIRNTEIAKELSLPPVKVRPSLAIHPCRTGC